MIKIKISKTSKLGRQTCCEFRAYITLCLYKGFLLSKEEGAVGQVHI